MCLIIYIPSVCCVYSVCVQHLCCECFVGEYVYWTDWHRRTVERVHKLTGKQRSVIVDQLPDVMGLTAVNMSALRGLSITLFTVHSSCVCVIFM